MYITPTEQQNSSSIQPHTWDIATLATKRVRFIYVFIYTFSFTNNACICIYRNTLIHTHSNIETMWNLSVVLSSRFFTWFIFFLLLVMCCRSGVQHAATWLIRYMKKHFVNSNIFIDRLLSIEHEILSYDLEVLFVINLKYYGVKFNTSHNKGAHINMFNDKTHSKRESEREKSRWKVTLIFANGMRYSIFDRFTFRLFSLSLFHCTMSNINKKKWTRESTTLSVAANHYLPIHTFEHNSTPFQSTTFVLAIRISLI